MGIVGRVSITKSTIAEISFKGLEGVAREEKERERVAVLNHVEILFVDIILHT